MSCQELADISAKHYQDTVFKSDSDSDIIYIYICISPFSDTPITTIVAYTFITYHIIPLYPFYIDIKTLSAMSAI